MSWPASASRRSRIEDPREDALPGTPSQPGALYDDYRPERCPDCWGMGWMRHDVAPDDRNFGKLVRCARPHPPVFRGPVPEDP